MRNSAKVTLGRRICWTRKRGSSSCYHSLPLPSATFKVFLFDDKAPVEEEEKVAKKEKNKETKVVDMKKFKRRALYYNTCYSRVCARISLSACVSLFLTPRGGGVIRPLFRLRTEASDGGIPPCHLFVFALKTACPSFFYFTRSIRDLFGDIGYFFSSKFFSRWMTFLFGSTREIKDSWRACRFFVFYYSLFLFSPRWSS